MVNITNILGQHLKRYEIKDRIGAGGMATVYSALDKNLNRDVAIKVLHEHLLHDDTFKDRFEQEAHFIAGFNHPNIVQVYDFDTIDSADGKIYYMVMPYLKGETLVEILDSCRANEATLPHERIKEIISDLADALDYAHARGMVHRDVKPANILFDEGKRAVLTDFGIARLAANSNLTADGTIIGTPSYMSPEQATGNETDYRSDIYSLGIILFELLTGKPPFDDESTVSLLLKQAQTAPPSVSQYLDHMNDKLDAVLNKVLEKTPDRRYQSARALKLALEDAVNHESPEERFEPHVMPSHPEPEKQKNVQPGTIVFEDEPRFEKHKNDNTITRTINTLVIKPAKQNPLGFTALAIGIIALLLVARLAQSPSIVTSSEPEEIGVDSMVAEYAYFSGEFAEGDVSNQFWEQSTGNIERRIEDGQYHILNTQSGLAITSLFDPAQFNYADVNIRMEAQIIDNNVNDSAAVGIVFRYQDAENYNVFAVDGAGKYSIWKREGGEWCELRTACNGGDATARWEDFEAVNLIGETNRLNLNVYGNQITAYVNDEFVFMIEEATFSEGAIGIYMATTQFGEAEVTIDNYEVTLGIPSSSNSMTADTTSMTDE